MDSIIFDVDGTLWDSTESVAASWNKAIREHSSLNLTLEPVSLSRVFGKTMTEIADTLFPSLSADERMKLLEVCFDEENRYLEDHPGILYPDVARTLKKLASRYPLVYCQQLSVRIYRGLAPYNRTRALYQRSSLFWRNSGSQGRNDPKAYCKEPPSISRVCR